MNKAKQMTQKERKEKIDDFRNRIKDTSDVDKKYFIKYDLFKFLEKEYRKNNLSDEEIREDFLPSILVLFEIGAYKKFEQIMDELAAYSDEYRYNLYRTYICYMHNDFEGMLEWLKIIEEEFPDLNDDSKVQSDINFLAAYVSVRDEICVKKYMLRLEKHVFEEHKMFPEALQSLINFYERRGDGYKAGNLIRLCEDFTTDIWSEYLDVMNVLNMHYRRCFMYNESAALVVRIINESGRFNLSDEERMLFDIQKVRLLFENHMQEWEIFSTYLYEHRNEYLSYSRKVALAFVSFYLSIQHQAYNVYNRALPEERTVEIEKDINKALEVIVPEIEREYADVSDDFLYYKVHLLYQIIDSVQIKKTDATPVLNKLNEEEYNYRCRIVDLCKKNRNDREYLHHLLVLADVQIKIDGLCDNVKDLGDFNELSQKLESKRGFNRDIISDAALQIYNILKDNKFNNTQAYYVFYDSFLFDFLGDEEKARELLIRFENLDEDYKNYSHSVQNIYRMLQSKYGTGDDDRDIKLRKQTDEISELSDNGYLKECAIKARDVMKGLEISKDSMPEGVSAWAVFDFLNLHSRVMLNANYIDECLDSAELFDIHASGFKMAPKVYCDHYRVYVEALMRRSRFDEASKVVDKVLQRSEVPDVYRIIFLKFKARMEGATAFPDFNISSICDALGIAEKIGDAKAVADIYRDLCGVFVGKYPALGVSFLRRAENYYLKNGDEHGLLVTRLYRAQAYVCFRMSVGRYPADVFSVFEREAAEIARSIDRNSFIHENDIVFYDRVCGMALGDTDRLWNVYRFYRRMGDISQAFSISEMIVIISSQKGDVKEALKAAEEYREFCVTQGDKRRIEHAERMIEEVKKGSFIVMPWTYRPGQYKTLLDILDFISLQEELFAIDKSPLRAVFPSHINEGMCQAITDASGEKVSLYPVCLLPYTYYRGQSERYRECKPSLFRNDMSDAKVYHERLKFIEFKLLIDSHPIIDKYKGGFAYKFHDGERKLPFDVFYLGLAQHYGIKTELMDITSDKWVAAFFAATSYKGNDDYTVYDGSCDEGVFYICNGLVCSMNNEKVIRPIGIQPFSRPGEQRGYAYEMKVGENFEDKCSVHVFRHDAMVNKLIFNFTGRSHKLFPYDVLNDKTRIINESYVFSKSTRDVVRQLFYHDVEESVLDGYCSELGIKFQRDAIVTFNSDDIEKYRKNLDRFEQNIKDNVIVQDVFTDE